MRSFVRWRLELEKTIRYRAEDVHIEAPSNAVFGVWFTSFNMCSFKETSTNLDSISQFTRPDIGYKEPNYIRNREP